MDARALLLIFLAAACHSGWNLLTKLHPRKLEFSATAIGAGLLLLSPVLFVFPISLMPSNVWLLVFISGIFQGGYYLSLTAAYKAGDLSLVYGIARGSAAVLVVPLAAVLFDEYPSFFGITGIVCVIGGIFLVSFFPLRRCQDIGSPTTIQKGAILWALATGVTIIVYSMIDKVGTSKVPIPLYLFCTYSVCLLVIVIALQTKGITVVQIVSEINPFHSLAAGVLTFGAYGFVLVAMQFSPLGYIVAGREMSIVFTSIIGVLWLKERHGHWRIWGSALIFFGLFLIAIAG